MINADPPERREDVEVQQGVSAVPSERSDVCASLQQSGIAPASYTLAHFEIPSSYRHAQGEGWRRCSPRKSAPGGYGNSPFFPMTTFIMDVPRIQGGGKPAGAAVRCFGPGSSLVERDHIHYDNEPEEWEAIGNIRENQEFLGKDSWINRKNGHDFSLFRRIPPALGWKCSREG